MGQGNAAGGKSLSHHPPSLSIHPSRAPPLQTGCRLRRGHGHHWHRGLQGGRQHGARRRQLRLDCRRRQGGPPRLGQPAQDPAVQPAGQLRPGLLDLLWLRHRLPRGSADGHPGAAWIGLAPWIGLALTHFTPTCPASTHTHIYPHTITAPPPPSPDRFCTSTWSPPAPWA
jgi:hypothetical protein